MQITAIALFLCALSTAAVAQSQPTPGLPSQPFGAAAQAQNGGAGPQVTYQYGIEFVTIGGQNGAAYQGVSGDSAIVIGRGAVNYEYRMSRYEVGQTSWRAFFDAVHSVEAVTGQPIPFVSSPGNLNGGGQYGRVGNISWRTAAMYANWLCNDQALTRESFMSGAYDVSTFGFGNGGFTDQLTHTPGAMFWIPTLDEWIHAAHYDPNRSGPEQGGWWQYSVSSDTFPTPGLPQWGAEANYAFVTPNLAEFGVPLGSYGAVQSPWGLFDTVGQTTEWLEEPGYALGPGLPTGRRQAGSFLNSPSADIFSSLGRSIGGTDPSDDAYWMGLRVAASIPCHSTAVALCPMFLVPLGRRRVAGPNCMM